MNIETPSMRTSKRPSFDAVNPPAKSARHAEVTAAAAAAEAAAAAAAAEAAAFKAATVIQAFQRGKIGRHIAANTCPPCAAACPSYAIDMNAAVFGSCIRCGFAKSGHTQKALKGGKAALKKRGSGELRAKMVQRAKASCLEFRVNMDPSLPFGTCMCGRPRAEHTEAALTVKGGMGTTRADSAELRKKMVQRAKASCLEFRVNMDPSLPFGTCMCGRPRAEHTEAALAADSEKGSGKRMVRKASADVRREMEAKQDEIGTAVETQGARTENAFGLGNTVRTAADEQAAVERAINARAGGADKAAALNDFNEMMKETAHTGAPAAASA